MKRQKVGTIGWLFDFDSEFAQTTAICDINQQKLDAFKAEHPQVDVYRDYRKLADEEFHPDAPQGKRVTFKRLEDYSTVHGFAHDIDANHAAFLQSCATGEPFHQDIEDAWRSHLVCLAAEASAVEGSPRTELDFSLA